MLEDNNYRNHLSILRQHTYQELYVPVCCALWSIECCTDIFARNNFDRIKYSFLVLKKVFFLL